MNGSVNGVPADQWGAWCPHGKRIVEPDPNRDPADPYPAGVIIDPWPCDADGCTREQYEQDCADAVWSHTSGVNP